MASPASSTSDATILTAPEAHDKEGSRSRSTSAGSSSPDAGAKPAQVELSDFSYPLPFLIKGCESSPFFQDMEHSSPVMIKNTFLDNVPTPTSLDDFMQRRDIRSCPAGAIGDGLGLLPTDVEDRTPMFIKRAFGDDHLHTPTSSDRPTYLRSGQGGRLTAMPELGDEAVTHTPFPSYLWEMLGRPAETPIESLRARGAAMLQQLAMAANEEAPPWEPAAMPPTVAPAPALPPTAFLPMMSPAPRDDLHPLKVVSIADALPEPKLGSPEAPTAGSMGHRFGNCKPCAFMHTKGCSNGVQCEFCHLCPPGERKRRQKTKQASMAHCQKLSLAAMLL